MNAVPPPRGRQFVQADRAFAKGGGLFWGMLSKRFHAALDQIDAGLEYGALEAWLPDGTTRVLGGRGPGPMCEVRLNSWRALVRLGASGSVGWYHAWTLGEWESPDPVPLFALFMRNAETLGGTARARGFVRLVNRMVHAMRANHKRGARRNIAFHYDLGNDFYRLWLDENLQYSSALFLDPDNDFESLERAQVRKINTVLDRIALQDDGHLLEIGCGWGGLARVALQRANIHYDGLTLSAAQKRLAEAHLRQAGVGDRARILLTDYRDATGQYDALVSVEMVEAVGQAYWPNYLATIDRLLKPGGRAALQYICINDAIFERYASSVDFIQAYVFPGGLLISESRFRALAEKQGFTWCDEHHFGQHYAQTLRHWRRRFDAAVESGRLPPAFDKDFIRLWRYYLMYCEGGFLGGGIDVAQVTLIKPA